MQDSIQTQKSPIAFELKGSLFTLTVLHLLNPDINVFTVQLRRHAQKTPHLFRNMPLVIDLQRVSHSTQDIDFTAIQHHLRDHGLVPVGVRHGNERQNAAAQATGLALLSSQTTGTVRSKPKPAVEPTEDNKTPAPHTLLITKPVRSGQQIYARQANLVVVAPVSNGAELLADGFIHVYGILRGRALAGVTGDKTARIFCQQLEAELISIAGYYRLNDGIPHISAPNIQVFLKDDQICIEGIAPKK